MDEKKGRRPPPSGRPFLLRRGTAGATTGSFKRRSLKLRRSGKESKEILDCDCKLVIKFILITCKLTNIKLHKGKFPHNELKETILQYFCVNVNV